MKVKTLITAIEPKKDKRQQDYWIIRTKAGNFLAFSTDYSLSTKARSLLANYPEKLINQWCLLSLRKTPPQDSWDKVIAIELV